MDSNTHGVLTYSYFILCDYYITKFQNLTTFTLVYLQYKHDLPNWTYNNNNNRQHDKFDKFYLKQLSLPI